jgi:hypothetical protein
MDEKNHIGILRCELGVLLEFFTANANQRMGLMNFFNKASILLL